MTETCSKSARVNDILSISGVWEIRKERRTNLAVEALYILRLGLVYTQHLLLSCVYLAKDNTLTFSETYPLYILGVYSTLVLLTLSLNLAFL